MPLILGDLVHKLVCDGIELLGTIPAPLVTLLTGNRSRDLNVEICTHGETVMLGDRGNLESYHAPDISTVTVPRRLAGTQGTLVLALGRDNRQTESVFSIGEVSSGEIDLGHSVAEHRLSLSLSELTLPCWVGEVKLLFSKQSFITQEQRIRISHRFKRSFVEKERKPIRVVRDGTIHAIWFFQILLKKSTTCKRMNIFLLFPQNSLPARLINLEGNITQNAGSPQR